MEVDELETEIPANVKPQAEVYKPKLDVDVSETNRYFENSKTTTINNPLYDRYRNRQTVQNPFMRAKLLAPANSHHNFTQRCGRPIMKIERSSVFNQANNLIDDAKKPNEEISNKDMRVEPHSDPRLLQRTVKGVVPNSKGLQSGIFFLKRPEIRPVSDISNRFSPFKHTPDKIVRYGDIYYEQRKSDKGLCEPLRLSNQQFKSKFQSSGVLKSVPLISSAKTGNAIMISNSDIEKTKVELKLEGKTVRTNDDLRISFNFVDLDEEFDILMNGKIKVISDDEAKAIPAEIHKVVDDEINKLFEKDLSDLSKDDLKELEKIEKKIEAYQKIRKEFNKNGDKGIDKKIKQIEAELVEKIKKLTPESEKTEQELNDEASFEISKFKLAKKKMYNEIMTGRIKTGLDKYSKIQEDLLFENLAKKGEFKITAEDLNALPEEANKIINDHIKPFKDDELKTEADYEAKIKLIEEGIAKIKAQVSKVHSEVIPGFKKKGEEEISKLEIEDEEELKIETNKINATTKKLSKMAELLCDKLLAEAEKGSVKKRLDNLKAKLKSIKSKQPAKVDSAKKLMNMKPVPKETKIKSVVNEPVPKEPPKLEHQDVNPAELSMSEEEDNDDNDVPKKSVKDMTPQELFTSGTKLTREGVRKILVDALGTFYRNETGEKNEPVIDEMADKILGESKTKAYGNLPDSLQKSRSRNMAYEKFLDKWIKYLKEEYPYESHKDVVIKKAQMMKQSMDLEKKMTEDASARSKAIKDIEFKRELERFVPVNALLTSTEPEKTMTYPIYTELIKKNQKDDIFIEALAVAGSKSNGSANAKHYNNLLMAYAMKMARDVHSSDAEAKELYETTSGDISKMLHSKDELLYSNMLNLSKQSIIARFNDKLKDILHERVIEQYINLDEIKNPEKYKDLDKQIKKGASE